MGCRMTLVYKTKLDFNSIFLLIMADDILLFVDNGLVIKSLSKIN